MNILDLLFEQPQINRFISRGERFFKKFPHLPYPLMEFLVSILPAIFFALGILHSVMGAIVIITGSQFLPEIGLHSQATNPLYLIINGMLAISNGILMLLSFVDITHQTIQGWRSLFLINTFSILQSLLSLVFFPATVFSVVIYILLTAYFTFEFKHYFKK